MAKVLRHSISYGIVPAIPFTVKRLVASDTLFVLGSGGSIAGIRRWEYVREHDSVGFNFWLLHDFVPDFYFTEAPRDESDRECLIRNLRRVQGRYKDVTFFNKVRVGSDGIDSVLAECRLAHHSLVPVAFGASSPKELRGLARRYRGSILMRHLFFNCQGVATVELAVLFGWTLGYKKIVLCGVDLTDTKYFFEQPQYEGLAARGFLPTNHSATGSVHKTNDPYRAWGGVTVTEVLRVFQQEVLRQGCQIYVESGTSSLAGIFPVHSLR